MVVVGELKDAWQSLFRVKQKAAAERVCPDHRPQVGMLAPKQGLDESYGRVNGIMGDLSTPLPKQVPTPQCHSGTKRCQQSHQHPPEIAQCHTCAFSNDVPSTRLKKNFYKLIPNGCRNIYFYYNKFK